MDKEALIEYASTNKDTLFIGLLVIILVVGGWFVYQQSAVSVDDIIFNAVSQDGGGGGGGGEGAAATKEVISADVVTNILQKRDATVYNTARNPFGSPADQLRTRQLVEDAYKRGEDLFKAGQYDQAAQQFDKVIALDVTETRIQYPILPSEYKRKAQQENAKKNFGAIMQSAQTDITEGDRLLAAGNKQEALKVYRRANDNLGAIEQSDPEGAVIGKDNIQNIKNLLDTARKKFISLLGSVLMDDINKQMAAAQQVMNGQDYVAMTRAMFQLSRVQRDLVVNDPNQTLVPKTQHDNLANMIQKISGTLKANSTVLVAQAEQAFTDALSKKDLQASQDALAAMRQVLALNPTDQELQKKINTYASQRANLVLDSAEAFYTQQKSLLDKNQFDQFDRPGLARLKTDVVQLMDLGAALDSATRTRVNTVAKNLTALRLPSNLTDAYEFRNPSYTNNTLKIEVVDKLARSSQPKTLYLKEKRRDRGTNIQLTQVDTANGFVILSKSGYLDAKVPIPAGSK